MQHAPVRLAVGRHRTPWDGTCVMELAAMLAGERFTDRPRCVDPVVAAFMRGFNDRLGDHSRQRLEPYARLAVGTREDRAATRARRDRCLAFAAGRPTRPRLARLRILAALGPRAAVAPNWGAAAWALRALDRRGVEPAGFPLLEELLRTSVPHGPSRGERPRQVRRPAQPSVAARALAVVQLRSARP